MPGLNFEFSLYHPGSIQGADQECTTSVLPSKLWMNSSLATHMIALRILQLRDNSIANNLALYSLQCSCLSPRIQLVVIISNNESIGKRVHRRISEPGDEIGLAQRFSAIDLSC